jgi:hypothetical protein
MTLFSCPLYSSSTLTFFVLLILSPILLFPSFTYGHKTEPSPTTSCASISLIMGASGESLNYVDLAHFSFAMNTLNINIRSSIVTEIENLHLVLSNVDADKALLLPTLNGISLNSAIVVPDDGLVELSVKNIPSWKASCGLTNVLVLTVIHSDCTITFTVAMHNEMCKTAGEPHFFGLRGQKFVIHPLEGNVYNLISSTSLQLNVEFVYLETHHDCPTMPSTELRASACWTAPASYMSRLGAMTSAGERILIASGSGDSGFSSVVLNKQDLQVGDMVQLTDGGYIVFNSTHELTFYSDAFRMTIENSDEFMTISTVSVDPSDWPKLTRGSGTHGLLGQTWRNKRYGGHVPEIEGDVDDYLVNENHLFGVEFVFNQFSGSR